MKITSINRFLYLKGTSQTEIAERLGLHTSTVSLLLAGKIHLPHRLEEIARMTGVSRKKLESIIEEDRRRAA